MRRIRAFTSDVFRTGAGLKAIILPPLIEGFSNPIKKVCQKAVGFTQLLLKVG